MAAPLAVAIFDFAAQNGAQIGLERGDTLIVTEKPKSGWWKGTNTRTNLTGAFPAVYVRLETDIERFKALYPFGQDHAEVPHPLQLTPGDIVEVLSKSKCVEHRFRSSSHPDTAPDGGLVVLGRAQTSIEQSSNEPGPPPAFVGDVYGDPSAAPSRERMSSFGMNSMSRRSEAVIAKPTEKSFEEEFNEYVKELPPVVPVAALIEILQEMETPEQKMYVFGVLKERGITAEGVAADSTFCSDIADLFIDSDYDTLKDDGSQILAHSVVLHARCQNLSMRVINAQKERAGLQDHDVNGPTVVSLAALGIGAPELRASLFWIYSNEHDPKWRHVNLRPNLKEHPDLVIMSWMKEVLCAYKLDLTPLVAKLEQVARVVFPTSPHAELIKYYEILENSVQQALEPRPSDILKEMLKSHIDQVKLAIGARLSTATADQIEPLPMHVLDASTLAALVKLALPGAPKRALNHLDVGLPAPVDKPADNLLLSQYFASIRGKYTDCSLVLGDQRVACHKAVLAARSTFFAGAFGSSFREGHTGEINIRELNSIGSLKALVHYFYEDYLPADMQSDAIVELLTCVDFFGLSGERLLQLCFDHALGRTPSLPKATKVWKAAAQKKGLAFLADIETDVELDQTTPDLEALLAELDIHMAKPAAPLKAAAKKAAAKKAAAKKVAAKKAAAKKPAALAVALPKPAAAGGGGFIPAGARFWHATTFVGSQPGYVYKTGPQGVGYYLEEAGAPRYFLPLSEGPRAGYVRRGGVYGLGWYQE